MTKNLSALIVFASIVFFIGINPSRALAAPSISQITDNRASYPGNQIPKFEKFEITFQISGSSATNLQLPYDPTPPNGIDPNKYPKHKGITVDALFLLPGVSDWNSAYRQPAFPFQPYIENSIKGWNYPQGERLWKVRFSPDQIGTWQYKLSVKDASGTSESPVQSFTVAISSNKGFIKVSQSDSRYFEYDDGTFFPAIGRQGIAWYNYPTTGNASEYVKYGQNAIQLVRTWMSGFYGSSWLEWVGGRNIYDGYLPRSGLEAFHDPVSNKDYLTMVIDYETAGDTGWYDGCRLQFHNDREAVKRNTNYKLKITYWGEAIQGPRKISSLDYGLVGKIGDWANDCYEPGTNAVITSYGRNTSNWTTIEGSWNSGTNDFLPRLHLAMENAIQGKAYIREISLKEDLGGGQLGPEILTESSLEYESYFPEASAYELDKVIELAKQNDIYFKLVLMDKDDKVFAKIDDDGTFVLGGEPDNPNGFYGLGRQNNKTRWLEQAYFRYLQARWGYSPNIHSWELTNEGDPGNSNHYALTDEMGKDFHCRIFGVAVGSGDGQKCNYNHPNDHLVTTSFWHSFPATEFWGNSKYPNVDYADVHAYISTGWLSNPAYENDEALFHWDYAKAVRNGLATKPIVRGETGLDYLNLQEENSDLPKDTAGIWLHNLNWASLDPYVMSELYWWKETLDTSPGPDGQPGLYEIYKHFYNFVYNIPLNKGGYQDAIASSSNQSLRVVGQKNTSANRAHLWIQNKAHTWRNVVDNVSITPQSGTISVSGFNPNQNLKIEWWDTYTGTISIAENINSNSSGNLTLTVTNLTTDMAVKIGDYLLVGDINGDGIVNILDYTLLSNAFGTNNLSADLNKDGIVNIVDYTLLSNNFGKAV